MIQVQWISKILNTSDISLLNANDIGVEYFTGYEEEISFVTEHYKHYGNVPDKATFLAHFPEFEIVDCTESDQYLLDTIREEHLYMQCVPLIQKCADLLQSDSNAAVEYLTSQMKNLQPTNLPKVVDIASKEELQKRKDEYINRRDNPDDLFFTTGFPELDDITHGLQRGEEFVVIVARTNQGKSWILEKIATHIWQIGFNVGYISPEMGALSIGYRFDTLVSHISNRKLMWGSKDLNLDEYEKHAESVEKQQNKFLTATPKDFNGSITVSKLRTFCQRYNLDALAIDGITYLSDERFRKGDTVAQSLTHISEDLMNLSVELSIPILVVVQANRQATNTEDAPELENIRDSDGIAYNASKVFSLRQRQDNVLILEVKKQRTGPVGAKLCYDWNIDTSIFTYLPNGVDDSKPEVQTVGNKRRKKKETEDVEDSF